MGKALVIVESPAKIKTLKYFPSCVLRIPHPPRFVNARPDRTLRAGESSACPPAIPSSFLRAKALKQSNRLFLEEAYSVGSILCQDVSRKHRRRAHLRNGRRHVHKCVSCGSSVKSLSFYASFRLLSRFRRFIPDSRGCARSSRRSSQSDSRTEWPASYSSPDPFTGIRNHSDITD